MIDFSSRNLRTWSRLGQRGTFGVAALELANENENILMITADMGSSASLDRYKATYPERLINVGIAEQNWMGVAAGLSSLNYIPFAPTYANFATLRCADQIKVFMGYMGLNIKLVGLSAGYGNGFLGPTHMSLGDIAFLRSMPKIFIISPADCAATMKTVFWAAKNKCPVYIRLTGSVNCPMVYTGDFDFEPGKANILKEGQDISIIGSGILVHDCLKAAEILEKAGLSVEVIDMHTISPLDKKAIDNASVKKLIVTVEEHSVFGGLGSAVAETLALKKSKPPQLILGAQGDLPHAANRENLLEDNDLTNEKIAAKILKIWKELA